MCLSHFSHVGAVVPTHGNNLVGIAGTDGNLLAKIEAARFPAFEKLEPFGIHLYSKHPSHTVGDIPSYFFIMQSSYSFADCLIAGRGSVFTKVKPKPGCNSHAEIRRGYPVIRIELRTFIDESRSKIGLRKNLLAGVKLFLGNFNKPA